MSDGSEGERNKARDECDRQCDDRVACAADTGYEQKRPEKADSDDNARYRASTVATGQLQQPSDRTRPAVPFPPTVTKRRSWPVRRTWSQTSTIISSSMTTDTAAINPYSICVPPNPSL